jgi:hypothetical protein
MKGPMNMKKSKKTVARHREVKPARVVRSQAWMAGIREPSHPMGYTHEDLLMILSPAEMKKFGEWIYGQTCAVDEKTRQSVIYEYDVTRFVNKVRHGGIDIWD